MALKHRTEQNPVVSSPQRPWGEVSEPGKNAVVLRCVLGRSAVSIPVATLKYWEFKEGPPETLVIHAELGVITIEGRGLVVLQDLLDTGKLVSVRANAGRALTDPAVATVVSAVGFVPKNSAEKKTD